jgi:hypothetical protein
MAIISRSRSCNIQYHGADCAPQVVPVRHVNKCGWRGLLVMKVESRLRCLRNEETRMSRAPRAPRAPIDSYPVCGPVHSTTWSSLKVVPSSAHQQAGGRNGGRLMIYESTRVPRGPLGIAIQYLSELHLNLSPFAGTYNLLD